jgi:cytosine/adenosine deaminase-related metal-dependent hydrolase
MKTAILMPLVLFLASCGSPSDSSPVKVIVGAQLYPGHDNPRLEHSVIVIRDGKFQAVGPQQSTPVPKGAQITSGMGKLVTPAPGSALIAPGQPADLVLRDAATNSAEMIMHDGEWLK